MILIYLLKKERKKQMVKRSKLCGRCHKTDIIDGVEFINPLRKISRESPTKHLCVDCSPIVLEKYNGKKK